MAGNVAHSVEVIMNLLSMLLGGVVRVTRGCGHGTWLAMWHIVLRSS